MTASKPIPMPRPRTHQTEWQYEIELMVADADAAQFGLRVSMTEVISEPVKSALLDLARRMCTLVHRPTVVYPHGEAPCVGVLLLRTRRPDGTPYAIALRTHEPIVRPDTHATKLLDDGFGPAPDDHLDGWRFTTAFTGLLRLLEREIRQSLKGDDWNWNDGSAPSASPADDEDWNPRTMLARIRRMRREVNRVISVEEVHQL